MTKVSRELTLLRAQLLGINGVRPVLYQAAGSVSGLIVTMEVYRPDATQDVAQSGTAAEIGNTGRYYLAFTADAPGWFVLITDNAGGSGIKQF
jgi:hypothetical protein